MLYDLHVVTFGILMAVWSAIVVIGALSKQGIFIMFSGLFLLVIFIPVTNLVLDSTYIAGETSVSYLYDVKSSSADLTVNAVSRSILAEFPVDSSSALHGDTFNCMSVYLNKVGSPPVGTYVRVGVFDGSGNLIKSFGALNVTQIGTSYSWYNYCLASGDSWTISALNNDRVGFSYAAGDGSNTIQTRRDAGNPFDGTSTTLQNYVGGAWATFSTANDFVMVLSYQTSTVGDWVDNSIPIEPIVKVMVVMFAALILLYGAWMFKDGDD